jgi:shikimate kinase
MIISLLGMPGCGKTTFGKELANSLQIPFFDLDLLIETGYQTSISTLFQQKGEHQFRMIETEALRSFFNTNTECILALGGGTPCFNDNISLINSFSESYYLQAPVQVIVDRLWLEREKRPLVAHLTSKAALLKWVIEKLKEREIYYKMAKTELTFPFTTTFFKY